MTQGKTRCRHECAVESGRWERERQKGGGHDTYIVDRQVLLYIGSPRNHLSFSRTVSNFRHAQYCRKQHHLSITLYLQPSGEREGP